MVVGTVIVLALYALLDTIISLLFSGAMWISRSIMDSSITIFSSNQNVITTFVNLLPFAGENAQTVVNVGSIIDGVAYGIMVLIILIGVIKSIAAPLVGDDTADNPINIVFRVIIAIVLKHMIFGFGTEFLGWSFNGLLGVFGRWFGTILSTVGDFNYESFTDINAWTLNPAAYIGALILMATLLGSVLGAAISYIERILSFAVSVLIGPIAISLYAYKDTQDVAKNWIMSIFTQFGCILLNLLLWGAFINQINSLEGLWALADSKTGTVGTLIFKLAIAIALLSLIRNCEKIFNTFGLRTMPNQDSARAIAGGVATLGSAALVAMRATPAAKAAVERGMHGKSPAMGGSFGRGGLNGPGGSSRVPYTGNASLFDKNGQMNIRGEGNKASNIARGVMARSAGNYNAKVAGDNSTRAAQNRQSAAIGNLTSAIEGKSAGSRITGGQIANSKAENQRIASGMSSEAPTYTGAQMANMALSGHANGSGSGFKFTNSANTPIGYQLTRDGAALMGVEPGEPSSAPSGSMVIGTTTNLNGDAVSGIAGQGIFENGSNGRVSDMGMYYLPTDYNGEGKELPVGSQVDLGDGREWFITGDGITIDDYGAKVYELATPQTPTTVQLSDNSLGEIREMVNSGAFEIDPFERVSEPEVVSTEDYGIENASTNDNYDTDEEA